MPESSPHPAGLETAAPTASDRRVESVDRCPACGSGRQRMVREQPDGLLPTGALRIVACEHCGLVFLNPRMSEEAMAQLEDVSEVYVMDAATTKREIAWRVDLLRTLVTRAPRSGRLLDVGCNRGLLLRAAQRVGWEAVGVEVSPVAAALARTAAAVPVYTRLDEVPRDDGFELVVAWHVLEHTTDPVSFLARIDELLAEDGVLALQVPSYDFAREFEERGMLGSLVCAVHTTYFTEAALVGVLRRAGFDVTDVANSPLDLMLTAFAKSMRGRTQSRLETDREGSGELPEREVALQARIVELERQLDAVLTSESWRLTAPLRLFRSRLRRLVGMRLG